MQDGKKTISYSYLPPGFNYLCKAPIKRIFGKWINHLQNKR